MSDSKPLVLVPQFPTPEMIDAGRWSEYYEESSRMREVDDDEVAGVWALMLAAAPKPQQWQPIETAPKDGREMFVVRAFGIDPTGRAPTGGYTSDAYAVFRCADGRLARWPHVWPPTHWMPLPAAPEEPGHA